MRRVGFTWVAICAVLGLVGTGYAAFSNHHSNTAQFDILTDYTPPAITSVVQKNEGGTAGFIRSGQPFKVFADAVDGGNPPSGIQSVTSYAPGSNVAMTAAANTVMGVNYGYVSPDKTTSEPDGTVIAGATGAQDNNLYQGFAPLSVVVDNTAPTPINVNAGNSAVGTFGRLNAGDFIDFTYDEPIDPWSLFGSKWNWVTKQATGGSIVVVPYNAGTSRTNIFMSITPAHTLGSFWTTGSYCTSAVSASLTFLVPSPNVLRARLGTVTGASFLLTDPAAATTSWLTTSPTGVQPFDRAGNILPAGTTVVESGAADQDF